MFYTYIIKSLSSGRLYIGQTSNLNERLIRHNQSRSKFTKRKGPWELVYYKAFESRTEAIVLERKLKSLKNKDYLLKKIEASEP